MYKLTGDSSFASSLEMFRIKSWEEQICDTFYASVLLEKKIQNDTHSSYCLKLFSP